MVEKLYRYDYYNTGYDVKLSCSEYIILKRTPCGVWIQDYSRKVGKRFVNLNARKQFASESKELAMIGFVKRKERQLSILRGQICSIELAIDKARVGLKEDCKL